MSVFTASQFTAKVHEVVGQVGEKKLESGLKTVILETDFRS
jgi:hypothetical protein